EDLGLAPGEELAQQRARGVRDLARARPQRIALLRVAAREGLEDGLRIRAARRGEAPRPDRGAHEVAGSRLRLEPLAEDRIVEAGDAERLGTAGGPRDHRDVGGVEAVLADALEGALAGAQRDGRGHPRRVPFAFPPPAPPSMSRLFSPLRLRGLELPHRV